MFCPLFMACPLLRGCTAFWGPTLKSAIFYDFMPKNAVFYANFMKINAILCQFYAIFTIKMNHRDKKIFLSETVDFNNKAKELLLNKEVPVFIADTCWIKKRFIEKQSLYY